MTVHILYFASLREALGTAGEQVDLPDNVKTVDDLRAFLVARDPAWDALATTKNLRAAVNQTMVDMAATIRQGDEVAFFPPVTGG